MTVLEDATSTSSNNPGSYANYSFLKALCYEAARRGAFYYFDALLTLRLGAKLLKSVDGCTPDLEATARKNGHEELADEIMRFMR